ncbi:MAG: metalloregulator ArsR/SmtB family transcription factor [Desulfotalea sp.]
MKLDEGKIYQIRADIIKSLAHPTRLWIVEQLEDGEKCVCEFVDAIPADISTISKHLSILKKAGIIVSDKRGKWVYYSLKTPCVLEFSKCIDNIIKQQIQEQLLHLK